METFHAEVINLKFSRKWESQLCSNAVRSLCSVIPRKILSAYIKNLEAMFNVTKCIMENVDFYHETCKWKQFFRDTAMKTRIRQANRYRKTLFTLFLTVHEIIYLLCYSLMISSSFLELHTFNSENKIYYTL